MHPNWKSLCTANFQWKQFVREGAPESSESEAKHKRLGATGEITGEEAKDFYENVILSVNSCKPEKADDAFKEYQTKPSSFNKDSNRKIYFNSQERWLNALLKEAQANNVTEVEKLLQFANANINEQDSFGWTALMAACYAGSVDVVQLLLAHGADTGLKDRGGNSCLSLAKSKGQQEILNILSHRTSLKQEQMETQRTEGKKVQFYCETCKMSFKNTSKQQHYTSTVHLFNAKSEAPKCVSYGIPCTNRGYQILVKSGWNESNGLGPEGAGRKFPLKTVLKRDRKGLGGHDPKRDKSRITHFGPRETEAVRSVAPRTKTRRQREAELCKDRRKERAWRREFAESF